eukprot:jgi/Tetstr1/457916/TSEL_044434.t1
MTTTFGRTTRTKRKLDLEVGRLTVPCGVTTRALRTYNDEVHEDEDEDEDGGDEDEVGDEEDEEEGEGDEENVADTGMSHFTSPWRRALQRVTVKLLYRTMTAMRGARRDAERGYMRYSTTALRQLDHRVFRIRFTKWQE